jgi:hypothetical protein
VFLLLRIYSRIDQTRNLFVSFVVFFFWGGGGYLSRRSRASRFVFLFICLFDFSTWQKEKSRVGERKICLACINKNQRLVLFVCFFASNFFIFPHGRLD